jgi:hypothetical protein
MSIWKDLLLHGGYVAATPAALRLVAPELFAPLAPSDPQPASPAVPPCDDPPPWAQLADDYLLLR